MESTHPIGSVPDVALQLISESLEVCLFDLSLDCNWLALAGLRTAVLLEKSSLELPYKLVIKISGAKSEQETISSLKIYNLASDQFPCILIGYNTGLFHVFDHVCRLILSYRYF